MLMLNLVGVVVAGIIYGCKIVMVKHGYLVLCRNILFVSKSELDNSIALIRSLNAITMLIVLEDHWSLAECTLVIQEVLCTNNIRIIPHVGYVYGTKHTLDEGVVLRSVQTYTSSALLRTQCHLILTSDKEFPEIRKSHWTVHNPASTETPFLTRYHHPL